MLTKKGADDAPFVVRPALREDEEGAVKRTLFAAAIALLGFAGAVWAEGPIVRWDQVIGVTGHESAEGLTVDSIQPTPRWIAVRDGRAMLNLETGFVSINISGVSYLRHFGYGTTTPTPLGGPIPASSSRFATFVCDSTTEYPVQVDTGTFYLEQGAASYRGFLTTVPAVCREHPDDIVLLLRTLNTGGTYFAFGAARTIQQQ